MAYYRVEARPDSDRLDELADQLEAGDFLDLEPFGRALTSSLRRARRRDDGTAVWVEEDYCSPPLAEERDAVLDEYFADLSVERVDDPEAAWKRLDSLPPLFPALAEDV